MHEKLEKLRLKPESVRRQVLIVTTLGVTALIILFWVFTFELRFESMNKSETISKTESKKPLSIMAESFGRSAQETKENASNFFNQFRQL